MPIHATEPFGFDEVPALINSSVRDSPLAYEPVPQVITVATGSMNPFDVLLTSLPPKPLTP